LTIGIDLLAGDNAPANAAETFGKMRIQ